MSFGALFGLADDKIRPSKNVLGISPALHDQAVRYFTATAILNGQSVKEAKASAAKSVSRLNASTLNSLSFIFNQVDDFAANMALTTDFSTISKDEIAAVIATGRPIPRQIQYNIPDAKILQQAFGRKVFEAKAIVPKNPFSGQNKKAPKLPAPSTTGGQTADQKHAQAAELNKQYQIFLKDTGNTDSAASKKLFQQFLRTPFHTGKVDSSWWSGSNAAQAFQQKVDAQLAVQDAKNAAALSDSKLAMAKASAYGQSNMDALIAENNELHDRLKKAVENFRALTDSGASYAHTSPVAPPASAVSVSVTDPTQSYAVFPPAEDATAGPSAPRCGVDIFCSPEHPECCDVHGLNGVDDSIQDIAAHNPGSYRRRHRLSGLGVVRRKKKRPLLVFTRDDDEITGDTPGGSSGTGTGMTVTKPGTSPAPQPARPQPTPKPTPPAKHTDIVIDDSGEIGLTGKTADAVAVLYSRIKQIEALPLPSPENTESEEGWGQSKEYFDSLLSFLKSGQLQSLGASIAGGIRVELKNYAAEKRKAGFSESVINQQIALINSLLKGDPNDPTEKEMTDLFTPAYQSRYDSSPSTTAMRDRLAIADAKIKNYLDAKISKIEGQLAQATVFGGFVLPISILDFLKKTRAAIEKVKAAKPQSSTRLPTAVLNQAKLAIQSAKNDAAQSDALVSAAKAGAYGQANMDALISENNSLHQRLADAVAKFQQLALSSAGYAQGSSIAPQPPVDVHITDPSIQWSPLPTTPPAAPVQQFAGVSEAPSGGIALAVIGIIGLCIFGKR